MAQVTDDAFGQFENLLREQIDSNVHDLELQEPVDVMWDLLDTIPAAERVGRATDLAGSSNAGVGGYEASWRVRLQRGGLVSGGSIAGNSLQKAGAGNHNIMSQANDSNYLNPLNAPQRSWLPVKMLLKRLKGCLVFNRTQIHNDIMADSLAEVAADGIEDAVFQVRKLISMMTWSTGSGVVAQVDSDDVTTTITEADPVWIAVDAGRPFRFVTGGRYVFCQTNTAGVLTDPRAGAVNNPGVVRCVGINPDNLKVGLQAEQGEGDLTMAADDYIAVEGMYNFGAAANYAMSGVPQLLTNTGTYPGTGYARASYPQLCTFMDDNSSSYVQPTPELVAKLIDKMETAGYNAPSIVIAEQSIWTLYAQLERSTQAVYQVPQGDTFQASGQVVGPRIGHGNMSFTRLSSSLCPANEIFGIEPSTFRRFMPLGGKTIRWAMESGGVAGVNGIFRPVTNGPVLTDLSVADFDVYAQMGQVDPRRCFRITGVHSQLSNDA